MINHHKPLSTIVNYELLLPAIINELLRTIFSIITNHLLLPIINLWWTYDITTNHCQPSWTNHFGDATAPRDALNSAPVPGCARTLRPVAHPGAPAVRLVKKPLMLVNGEDHYRWIVLSDAQNCGWFVGKHWIIFDWWMMIEDAAQPFVRNGQEKI